MGDVSFVFSTLLPAPKIVFQYDNAQAAAFIREPDTKEVQITLQTDQMEQVQLQLDQGVLTLQYCDHILKALLKSPALRDFKQKVDPEKDGVPNYSNIVKHPMDLKTLQDRLYCGLVTTVEEFKKELDLIWDNCELFNGPDHQLTKLAKQVQMNIDNVWRGSRLPAPSTALESLKKLKEVLKRLDSKISNVLNIPPRPDIPPAKKPPKPTPKPQPQPVAQQPKPAEGPPNHQQRKLIAEKLSTTPVSEMRKAWNILIPHLKEGDALEKQQISLDNLPDQVLIELKKAVLV